MVSVIIELIPVCKCFTKNYAYIACKALHHMFMGEVMA